MKKIIKLNEAGLQKIIKKITLEEFDYNELSHSQKEKLITRIDFSFNKHDYHKGYVSLYNNKKYSDSEIVSFLKEIYRDGKFEIDERIEGTISIAGDTIVIQYKNFHASDDYADKKHITLKRKNYDL